MKLFIVGLLVFCGYATKAQSKWNTSTLDTVVIAYTVIKPLKVPEYPVGERKGQPIKIERNLKYIDSSLKKIKL